MYMNWCTLRSFQPQASMGQVDGMLNETYLVNSNRKQTREAQPWSKEKTKMKNQNQIEESTKRKEQR